MRTTCGPHTLSRPFPACVRDGTRSAHPDPWRPQGPGAPPWPSVLALNFEGNDHSAFTQEVSPYGL